MAARHTVVKKKTPPICVCGTGEKKKMVKIESVNYGVIFFIRFPFIRVVSYKSSRTRRTRTCIILYNTPCDTYKTARYKTHRRGREHV